MATDGLFHQLQHDVSRVPNWDNPTPTIPGVTMTAITDNAIAHFQLAVWRGALRLEKVGMKRRGQSVRKIAQAHFNMPKATCDQLIDRINKELGQ